MTIDFSRLNPRFRYLNVFLGRTTDTSATSLGWDQYFRVLQTDLTTESNITWTVVASGSSPFTAHDNDKVYNINHWNARGTDLVTYLGTTEYNNSTVSFSYGRIIGDRLLVAKYYDYTTGLNNDTSLRYSGFGDNIAQYNVLPDVADSSESVIVQDDGSAITGLSSFETTLFIAKKGGVYYITVSGEAEDWVLTPIARFVGSDAPYTIVNTPFGVVWAKSGEDIYLWNGKAPIGLTKNWLIDFRALSTANPEQWMGWYNAANKSYNIKCDTSDASLWYEMFFEIPVEDSYAWVKHDAAHNLTHVSTRVDNTVYFTNGTVTYYFSSATDDGGTSITPYLDTGDYVFDEDSFVRVDRWWLDVSDQAGTPSGDLDAQLFIDGTGVTVGGANPYAGLTKTNTYFNLPAPLTIGKRVKFQFNNNATPAYLGTAYTINELGFDVTLFGRTGDATIKK